MTLICQPGFLVITFWRVLSLEKLIGSFLNQHLSNLNFYMHVYPKKVLLNRFTLYVITEYNFIARVYVKLMEIPMDLDPPKCVHHLLLNLAISDWPLLIDNKM